MILVAVAVALIALTLPASSAYSAPAKGPYICFYGEAGEPMGCNAAEADRMYQCRIQGGAYERDGTCTPGEREPGTVCDNDGNCYAIDHGCFYDDGTMDLCTAEESEMNRWCQDAGGRWTREGRCRRGRGRPVRSSANQPGSPPLRSPLTQHHRFSRR